ncbi:ComGF family competence protein [Bacillus sp. Marseille-P3661]|uniref:ComGF family competence protein n=1 Tax=Bacillus sp. Marseille-P3661 TaxID=1936234 RepID=UPI0015E18E9D|nr:ComGF family competence protein [Bacillus sp. Marseille-P3661]
MLEFLFSFSIFLLLVTFFPIVIGLMADQKDNSAFEIDIFYEHLRMEIVTAKGLEVNNNTLILIMGDASKVSYELYDSSIRRRVNGAGNEILIQRVDHVSYELVSNGVIISITQDHKAKKKRLSLAPILI